LVRENLESRLGPEWAARVDEIARLRQAWRQAGADSGAIGRRTAECAGRHGWLPAAP
jgi:hypothetical protein